MRIGVTGAGGRMGSYLVKKYGYIPVNCDVTHAKETKDVIKESKVDLVLHLAAITDVEWCEKTSNWGEVIRVNLGGTVNVSQAAKEINIPMVLMSSDHVFDGKSGPYKEDYKFIKFFFLGKKYRKPVNGYGLSKLTAEGVQPTNPNMKIVRTSYLFDKEHLGKQADYPTFIYRSFMYLPHFCYSLNQYFLSFDNMPKILNISGASTDSWFDFAKSVSWIAKPRNKEMSGFAPRPYRGGLNIELSLSLGFPKFYYSEGIKEMQRG